MSSRSYLSIGDVLTLLRQEFPDVTISKIRFLESQGLVNPERTPSGYRKFYEHDVERLRWVLRQQREHFLPLKVIKDRLEEDAKGTAAAMATPEPVSVGGRSRAVEPAPTTDASSSSPDPTASRPENSTRATGIPAIHNSDASNSSPAPDGPRGPTPIDRAPGAALATPAHLAASHPPGSNGSGNGAGARVGAKADPASASGSSADKGTPRSTRSAVSAATASVDSDPAARPAVTRGVPAGSSSSPSPSSAVAGIGGASLSMEELTGASGLTEGYVGQLQEYGLIRATMVAGTQFFDEEALTVANVAAKFAAFGIEARHLRLYKNAADREAGFIEQIVVPMVRQRNPEARARATQTADDLATLGRQLKGSLLRNALRDLLNG